jgi:hypothetical protein
VIAKQQYYLDLKSLPCPSIQLLFEYMFGLDQRDQELKLLEAVSSENSQSHSATSRKKS